MKLLEDKPQKKIDQEHWDKGTAAPWRCSKCYEKDKVFVIPCTLYSKAKKHPVRSWGFLRMVIDKCIRCGRELYGGLQVDLGKGWKDTDDLEEWVDIDIREGFHDPIFSSKGQPIPEYVRRFNVYERTLIKLIEWFPVVSVRWTKLEEWITKKFQS